MKAVLDMQSMDGSDGGCDWTVDGHGVCLCRAGGEPQSSPRPRHKTAFLIV